jgi:biotin-(acetyl-CoA carboxylase) ligase
MNINQGSFSPMSANRIAANTISLQEITNKNWDVKQMQKHLSEALTTSIQNWLTEGDEKTIEALNALCIEINDIK